jgi:LysR family transcriptional regulator, benzoate and cis,cis-muconate-responsive activator of ben and cat genes
VARAVEAAPRCPSHALRVARNLLTLRNSGIRYRILTKKPDESCPIFVARGKGLLLTARSYAPQRPSNTRLVPLQGRDLKHRVAFLWRKDAAGPETLRLLE